MSIAGCPSERQHEPMTKQRNVADSDGDVRARPAAALLCPCPVACQVTWFDLANNWLGAVTNYQLVQITCQLHAVIRVMSINTTQNQYQPKGSSESTTPYSWQMANKYDYLSLVLQTSNTLFWTYIYFVLFIWKFLNIQMFSLLYCIRSFSCRDSSSPLPSRRTYKPPKERYWGSSSFCDQLYFFRRDESL